MPIQHTAPLRFDRFTLLPTERQLLVDGEPAKLGGRAFDLLLALVERRERTVTRAELFELVWAGRIVEDHNLQVQVLTLRKVLGPKAIATIPGRGYRFAMTLLDEAVPSAPTVRAAAPVAAIPATPTSSAGAPVQSNLPATGPALHGRVNDIAAVCRLLAEHRLVTLAGAGGIGKTRLAQAVANQLRSRFPDGVWMVELASVGDDPEQICSAIAGVLGLTSSPLAGNADNLARAMSSLDLLLVLDNCEHLVDAAGALVRALLERAPKVHLLVTSQEPLHARGEQVYRLGALALPASRGEHTQEHAPESGAVTLFIERVQATDRRFALNTSNTAAVIDICRRLDGNPLAIELAAARIPLLGVEGVRSRLDERFRLLTGGSADAPQRHRTLLDTIEWSHALLAADEQAVFRRLGVFAGSFSLAAARLVAGGGSLSEWAVLDHLGALVDKSLVLVDGATSPAHDAEPRYRMLESPRAYALEALAACGEVVATRRRHALSMLELFAGADDSYHLEPTLAWMARLAPDLHNCREAFGFSMSTEGEPSTAIGIAATAATFASAAGRGREGYRALERVWPLLAEHATPEWRARAWLGKAQLGSVQAMPPDEAVQAAQEAADAFRALADREHLYRALYMLSQFAENSADMALAERATDEMKRIESAEWPTGLTRLSQLRDARRLRREGRLAESRDAFHADALRCLASGDAHRAWVMLHHVALDEIALGNVEQAARVMREAVEQIRRHGLLREMWQQVAMHALTEIECGIERADPRHALPVVREVMALLQVQGSVWWLADHLAWLPELRGDSSAAACLTGWADAQARSRNAKRGPIMQRAHDRLAARLESNLGADRLARLRADGAALRDDEVLAIALREPG